MNDGLSTLQFISLSVSPFDANYLQGGTQDNGTWENNGAHRSRWNNTMIGDGGWSGFDIERPEFRFHTFFDVSPEVNFNSGDVDDWIWTADPIYGQPGTQFYAPVISDPRVSGTMFAGTGSTVYRTKTHGLGTRTHRGGAAHLQHVDRHLRGACGDWEQLVRVPLTGPHTATTAGPSRRLSGPRATRRTAWAATTTGRVFISKNVDAEPASAVTWTRLDTTSNDPNRFVSASTSTRPTRTALTSPTADTA